MLDNTRDTWLFVFISTSHACYLYMATLSQSILIDVLKFSIPRLIKAIQQY